MNQTHNLQKRNNKLVNLYWGTSASLVGMLGTCTMAFAATTDFWTKLQTMFADVYDKILGISTIVAVVMAAVALVLRMVSKNQRTVDEATQWLKRIVITWIILNSLGFIVAYVAPLVDGGKYTS